MVSDNEKVSDYEIRLLDLDTEHLGIPVCIYDSFNNFDLDILLTETLHDASGVPIVLWCNGVIAWMKLCKF